MSSQRPILKRLGTLDCDMVEATPVVFRNRLYRFEYVRANYWANATGDSYFRFIDVASGEPTPAFAKGSHLGCAYVQGDTVYAYGVAEWGEPVIQVFWSQDLETWNSQPALELPGWKIYNTSVCQGLDRFVMAFEVGEPPEVVGTAFTNYFAESDDLRNWTLLPSECVFTKEKYSACPALRFLDDGYYYMIYLETRPGPTYESYIVRSRDLARWESSPLNPVMQYAPEDKLIANPDLSPQLQERIAGAVNINNSDVDLCEFEGKVVLYYSWGNQHGVEHLAEAVYEGTMVDFLKGFFPE